MSLPMKNGKVDFDKVIDDVGKEMIELAKKHICTEEEVAANIEHYNNWKKAQKKDPTAKFNVSYDNNGNVIK